MPGKEKTEAELLGEQLRPMERLFVREYLANHMNGKLAASLAGYSEKTAASQASRLLRKPEIKAYRDALLKEQFEAIGVTKHSIAAEAWSLYQRCTEKEPVLEWNSASREWEHKGVWTFDVKGALKALEMLSKMLPDMKQGDDEGESLEDMLMGGGGREF